MTEAQKKWLAEHPNHKRWKFQGMVSLTGWTDVGYVYPNGRFAETGDDGKHMSFGGQHMISSGSTLYVIPPDAIKVGREYAIC